MFYVYVNSKLLVPLWSLKIRLHKRGSLEQSPYILYPSTVQEDYLLASEQSKTEVKIWKSK